MMTNSTKVRRSEEITNAYLTLLDEHLADLVAGRAIEMMEINQIASELCISPKHLSNTIQQTLGHHPCHFYDQKILQLAKKLLRETDLSIAEVARKLTYDPSNFSKFFKKYVGLTPGTFRRQGAK